MPDDKRHAAVEAIGTLLPYAKGGGWIGVAAMLLFQYQQTQTAQTKAGAGVDQAQAATSRESELRGAARAMYLDLNWRLDQCHEDVGVLSGAVDDLREDFNIHQHDRRGRGTIAEPFVQPTDDDPVSVGPVRLKRSTVRRTADILSKPRDVAEAQDHAADFFEE